MTHWLRIYFGCCVAVANTVSAPSASAQFRDHATVAGDATALAVFGDLERKLEEDENRQDGLRNLVSVDVVIVRELDDRDWQYGGVFSLETELDGETREQQSFAFFESGSGEFRLGSDDPAGISLRTGPSELAVGTGGLDGEIVDTGSLVTPTLLDNDAVRAIAYPASFLGIDTGFSLAAGEDDDGWLAEGAMSWRPQNVAEPFALTFGAAWREGADYAIQVSAHWAFEPMAFGISTIHERVQSQSRKATSAGVAIELDAVDLSLTGGYCHACGGDEVWNWVFGFERDVLDDLTLFGEFSCFDEGNGVGSIGLLGLALEF